MAQTFSNASGTLIVERLIDVIHENRAYLSEIDGAIGDGDHGINMDKGFTMAKEELAGQSTNMSSAMKILGDTLLEKIGGSMGPLYGVFFRKLARASKKSEEIGSVELQAMLEAAYGGIQELGNAKVGDKTLIDTLDPAVQALKTANSQGASLSEALDAMLAAAENGWKSTKDMLAKVGRASRLGERSRGVLDAGASSCFLILQSMAETIKELTS